MFKAYEPDEQEILAVEMAMMCKQLKVLPRAGGVLDQDWYELALLKAGLRAIAIKEEQEMERRKK